jgi:hypothetical protein
MRQQRLLTLPLLAALLWLAACLPTVTNAPKSVEAGEDDDDGNNGDDCWGPGCPDDGGGQNSGAGNNAAENNGGADPNNSAPNNADNNGADNNAQNNTDNNGANNLDNNGTNNADNNAQNNTDPGPQPDACGDERTSLNVYYGTPEPTVLPMTPGQTYAVGSFNGCSGLLIAPTWALSAEHCGLRRGGQMCFGEAPANPRICVRISNVFTPPPDGGAGDMALLELEQDVTARFPAVTPVPILTEAMDNSWVGRTVEAAGYGSQEDGGFNEREFVAEPIVDLYQDLVTVDGQGRHGVCFGDSGGPLMTVASDGTIRTIGVLSHGDQSCVGQDNFTRVDIYKDWIESHTGPTVIEGARCGEVTTQGRCLDGRALWCGDEDALQSEACAAQGQTCGWDASAQGFRCIQGADPCQGYDLQGACDGSTARWCEGGVPKARDCGACGQTCGLDPALGQVYCIDDPCQGIDYLGICDGDTAVYCKDNRLQSRDCAAEGQECTWVNDRVGNWCD